MSDSTQTADLLPFECYYENSGGEVIRFDQPPMMIRSSELFDYQWRLTTFDRAMHDGGKVVFARRPVQDKTLALDVFADTQEAHNAALNRLHDVLDYDVRRLTPGKLWVNGQYIRCLAFASIKTLDRDWTRYTVVKLSLRVVSPAWVEEHSVVLMPAEETADDNLNKRYPGRYPYRYADDDAAYRFLNDTGAPLPMILRFFGPCRNPSVFVGGNEYSLETETPTERILCWIRWRRASGVWRRTEPETISLTAGRKQTIYFCRRPRVRYPLPVWDAYPVRWYFWCRGVSLDGVDLCRCLVS